MGARWKRRSRTSQPDDQAFLSAASTPEAMPEDPIENGATAAMAKSPYLSASFSGTSRCSSPLARLREASLVRSYSFQRLRRRMQRAGRWARGGNDSNSRNISSSGEQGFKPTLNLEVMTNQKRRWCIGSNPNHGFGDLLLMWSAIFGRIDWSTRS